MTEKFAGPIGPADAMSAIDPEFMAAYSAAAQRIFDAVTEFERRTGRVVDSIALERIDVTMMSDPGRRMIRQASLHFLPKPGEVAW